MGKVAKPEHQISEAAARYARASLTDALFTATQRRVLACLFSGEPVRSYTVSELIQRTGAGSGAVQREIARLSGSGLLEIERSGNQKRYRANPRAPIHDELVSIVRKTFGLVFPLREALAPLASRIDAAFVYGSVGKRSDTASSDIDLMLISDDLTYAEAMGVLHPLTSTLQREINPTILTCEKWRARDTGESAFVSRVREQPKVWIFGGDHDLAA